MAWIEYHTKLRDHWKIKRLADALEINYISALGAISCLWLWCAEYAPKGDLRRFTDDEIRFASRIEHQKFTKETLKTCELLTDGQFINDWGKHGLKLLQSKRKANREYARKKRKSGYPLDTERVAIPNLTIPNHTNNNIPQEIYDFYAKNIKTGGKEDAIRSITKLLKTISKEELLARINAYKAQLTKSQQDPKYYIQANNFFGRAARYKDFEPVKSNLKAADPNCKLCSGTGWVFIEAKNGNEICTCRRRN